MRALPRRRERRAVDSIEVLFHREWEPMVRLAFTLVGDEAEAEEIVQESFADIHRRGDDIRSPGGYLRSSVVSRSRSVLRRRQVMALHPPEPPGPLTNTAGELWDVLHELSEDQRVTIVLRYYGRYRASEIAEIMDVPAPTVRSHLKRGLAMLRKELER